MQNNRHSFTRTLSPRILLIMILMMSLFASGTKSFADPVSEHDKIVYLLNVIGSSNLAFVRNGSTYTGAEAKAHLEEKVNFIGDHVLTAEDFINYIASESSTSGVAYFVRSNDGTEIEAGIWLRDRLAKMK